MTQEPRRDAEIDHLDLAGLEIEHDVGGVEIVVNHVLAMDLPQDRGNLPLQPLGQPQCAAVIGNGIRNREKVVVRRMRKV